MSRPAATLDRSGQAKHGSVPLSLPPICTKLLTLCEPICFREPVASMSTSGVNRERRSTPAASACWGEPDAPTDTRTGVRKPPKNETTGSGHRRISERYGAPLLEHEPEDGGPGSGCKRRTPKLKPGRMPRAKLDCWQCADLGPSRSDSGEPRRCQVTYLSTKAEPYVRPLAERLESPFIVPCDVREPGQLEAARIKGKWGRLDFLVHSMPTLRGRTCTAGSPTSHRLDLDWQ
jgi:hypothetical protein